MLSGMRGKGGGYVLTRPPEQYTVGEILRLTEGSLAPVACWMATARVARALTSAPRSTCGRTWTSLSTTTSTV